jgi:uncharacterized membrane protein YhaH (DUF805 family)
MNWYLEALKKYADFSGRSRRKEYWLFVLFSVLISIVLQIIDGALGLFSRDLNAGLLSSLYGLAVLIPSIAVAIRRLHDTGRSGWMYLLIFVPCIGWILLLVWFIEDSSPGTNEYGPNPKKEIAYD